jgi:hypothetical protein
MTTTGLNGPYKLDNKTIDEKVTKKSAGAYALGSLGEKKGFIPEYVGRSDDNINDRLKKWVDKGYTHFKFKYYGSPKAAFEKECNLYHDWKKQLDNKQHPDRPDDANWQCPRCDTFKEKK